MKLFVVLIIASCIALSHCVSDEILQQLMALRQECSKQSGVPEEVLVKMEKGEFTENTAQKEFFLCFFTNGGFMTDEGEVEADFVKMTMTEEFGADVANKIDAACGKISGATPQDTAFLLASCIHANEPSSA